MKPQPITVADHPQERDPLLLASQWLEEEPGPNRALIATCAGGVPCCRVVALYKPLTFFTQKSSAKVSQLQANPKVEMTLWLPITARQIRFAGEVAPLTREEVLTHWQTHTRSFQLKFSTYAPTSGQPIESRDQLKEHQRELEKKYAGQEIPCPDDYVGFRLKPNTVSFYDLDDADFSWAACFESAGTSWTFSLLSP